MKNLTINLKNKIRDCLSCLLQKFNRSKHKTHVINSPEAQQLQSVISATKQNAQNAQKLLGGVGSRIQNIIDNADATIPLIPYIEPNDIEEIGIVWNELSKQTEHVYEWLDDTYSDTDTAAGTASLTSVTTTGVLFSKIVHLPSDSSFKAAWSHYTEVTNRPNLKTEVIELIKSFNLHRSPQGKKSTLELFKIAHEAYEFPISQDNPVITSLIPLRESIESAIDELMRLRPRQEKTGSSYRKKLLSIGTQLRKDTITDIVLQEWGDQWHDISDKDLSAAKRYNMSRDVWSIKLNRATQFFHSFLTGLDPKKLRNT